MDNNIYNLYWRGDIIVHDYAKFSEEAEILKALGHPIRLCIVTGLLGKECNVTTMQQCLKLPQPIISQHLAVLKKKGIIEGGRKGTEISYKVVDQKARAVAELLWRLKGEA
ncbi:MAG: regulatory protein ArsR [Peptococcaceae bacterium]|jgi:ArsR family transcriptional regulator|nr:regulatory protein ArsR [Peptococcaceae bacterium]